MSEILDCFSHAPIFSKISEKDRSGLLDRVRPRIYEKGHYLCWQEDIWPKAGFIVSGSVEWTMLSPDGRRQMVFRLNACDVIWAHSLIDHLPMPASLEVKERSTIYLWDAEMIKPVISRYPEALWDVSGVLMGYMRQVREIMYGFAFQPVAGRLARKLIEHYRPEVGKPIQRTLTLEEMAESVGTTKELVSRTLHRFADEGIIQVKRMEFMFKDIDKLEQVAGGVTKLS
jgi:CRP-like cAMP-binding protein